MSKYFNFSIKIYDKLSNNRKNRNTKKNKR